MYNSSLSFIKNNHLPGQMEKLGSEVTHLRSRGIIFQGLLCTAGCCQAMALDGEVAMAMVDKESGEVLGGTASADAHRQTALPERHESCWSLRQLSPSPPPTLPPLPLPSVRHTHTCTHTHIKKRSIH